MTKNAATKTTDLTPEEIEFTRNVTVGSELQRATIAAKLRTGKRIGVTIGRGRYSVVTTAFALGYRSGQPVGSCDVHTLADNLTEAEAIAYLDSIERI